MTALDTSALPAAKTMLTTKELAARWGVSAGSLANDRALGRSTVPYVKIGDRVRYRLSDIVRFEDGALRGVPVPRGR